MEQTTNYISAGLLHFHIGKNTLQVQFPFKVSNITKVESLQKDICIVQASKIDDTGEVLEMKVNCDAGRTNLEIELSTSEYTDNVVVIFPVLVSSAGKNVVSMSLQKV